MKNNAKSQKAAVIVLAVIIAASLAFVIFQSTAKSEKLCAVVSVGNEKVAYIVLDAKYADREIDLKQYGANVVLETEGNKIKFKSSDCPDKICINNGWLSQDMDISVCMPNKTSVVIVPRSQMKNN